MAYRKNRRETMKKISSKMNKDQCFQMTVLRLVSPCSDIPTISRHPAQFNASCDHFYFPKRGSHFLQRPLSSRFRAHELHRSGAAAFFCVPLSGSIVSRRSLQSVLDVVFSLTAHALALLSPSTLGERPCEVLAMIILSSSPQGICAIAIKLEWQ